MRTIVVDIDGKGDYISIANALEQASPFDVIMLKEGIYKESFSVNKPVEIVGSGENTIIAITNKNGLVCTSSHLVLKDLTLCSQSSGTQVLVNTEKGHLIVSKCVLDCSKGNIVISGKNTKLIMEKSIVKNSSCAGITLEKCSTGSIQTTEFYNNDCGISISDGGNPLIRDCTFFNNSIGININKLGEGFIDSCLFKNNDEGILVMEGSNPVIRSCQFEHNKTAALFEHASLGIIEDCFMKYCDVGVNISNGSNPILRSVEICSSGNYGLFFQERANGLVQGCVIAECSIGVKLINKANPLLRHVHISHCNRHGFVAAKDSEGLLEDCEISFCQGSGCQIDANSKTEIRNSRINYNRESGVFVSKQAGVVLVNCHINGNYLGVNVDKHSWFEIIRSQIVRSETTGVLINERAFGLLERSYICANLGDGIETLSGGEPVIRECSVSQNFAYGITLRNNSKVVLIGNYIKRNGLKSLNVEKNCEIVSLNNDLQDDEGFFKV